jgi:hypothetical protein
MEDGGARVVLHGFAWFLGIACGFMVIHDDPMRSEQRDRSHTLVESASSERWPQAGVRAEHGACMRWSYSECVHGDVCNVTTQYKAWYPPIQSRRQSGKRDSGHGRHFLIQKRVRK